MRRLTLLLCAGLPAAVGLLCLAPLARSSDHGDGPQAIVDITADVADLFAWMSPDGTKVELVLDVIPFAVAQDHFSNEVQYVFHTTSRASKDAPVTASTDVICTFDQSQTVSCWVGSGEYVTGNATATAGITSASGKVRVFTGPRNDPAFWNKQGFMAAAAAVKSGFGGIAEDDAGCPLLNGTQSGQMTTDLATDGQGGAAKDAFVGANVYALVVEVDKTLLVSAQAPLLGGLGEHAEVPVSPVSQRSLLPYVASSLASAALIVAYAACSSGPGNIPDSTFNGHADAAVAHDTNVAPLTDVAPIDSPVSLVDSGTHEAGPNPPPPVLGAIIDRVGRPYVNVILSDPFDTLEPTTVGAAQDAYNSAEDAGTWVQLFEAQLAQNLRFWDGFDGTCNTQLLAGTDAQSGRYIPLAKLLADDQLYVDTTKTTCTTYLAVELTAAGHAVSDCGGRTPLEDVADTTYTLLTQGLSGLGGTPTTDGVSSDADGPASLSAFPFLIAPTP